MVFLCHVLELGCTHQLQSINSTIFSSYSGYTFNSFKMQNQRLLVLRHLGNRTLLIDHELPFQLIQVALHHLPYPLCLGILRIAGTPTLRDNRMCSRVCGIGPSAADTTRIAPSICAAPVIMFLT